MLIKGRLLDLPDPKALVLYTAASPPDLGGSFSGSGFPFANEIQAFESSPNSGVLEVGVDGSYRVSIIYPNSFYQRLGSSLVPPTLFIRYKFQGKDKFVSQEIGPSIPFRTLTYPELRRDVSFYDRGSRDMLNPDRDARTQETILRESAYPSDNQPSDFWGLVTPQ